MHHPPVIQERGERPTRIEAPLDPRLTRMRFLSRFLDNSIWLPGGYRIGFDPIIGLVPGVGDFLTSTLSFWIIFDAARMGIKKRILARMAGNVLLEAMVGVIPVLGDIFDFAWKANARNFQLMEKHFSAAVRPRSARRIGAVFVLALLSVYAMIFGALYFVWQTLWSLFASLT